MTYDLEYVDQGTSPGGLTTVTEPETQFRMAYRKRNHMNLNQYNGLGYVY